MNGLAHPLFKVGLVTGWFCLLVVLESARPLRNTTQNKRARMGINLSLGLLSALVVRFSLFPLLVLLCSQVHIQSWGLLELFALPKWIHFGLSLILLDWSLYYWHRMNHKWTFLWRFHNVHHTDLDMDASTAFRFHVGELVLSTVFRALQIRMLGINLIELITFETTVTLAAQFHHSNIRLPKWLEVPLMGIFVTPTLHATHHSIVQEETDSNYSAIFSVWDRIHLTFTQAVPSAELTIGVAAYRNSQELSLLGCLLLPVKAVRIWRLPDGGVPKRN